jgi:hypothetical protein
MIDTDKIVSLCKRRGFIFQSSEIYGGTGSCREYRWLGSDEAWTFIGFPANWLEWDF